MKKLLLLSAIVFIIGLFYGPRIGAQNGPGTGIRFSYGDCLKLASSECDQGMDPNTVCNDFLICNNSLGNPHEVGCAPQGCPVGAKNCECVDIFHISVR